METVVSGSYDRFLFGFQCSTSGRDEDFAFKRTFTHPAHKGPVKCVAAAAPYLVSGGADDLVHLYDMQTDVDLGFLMSPGDGAVSALAFHSPDAKRPPSHLFSGAADGSLSVWQAGGEWICLKTFHGHKKEVSSISIHPTGRLALSTSQDSSLRLWNLVKGKCAHTTTLTSPAEQVAFSPSGSSYAVVHGPEVTLHAVESEPPTAVFALDRRAQCLAYPCENCVLTGSEEGAVRLWDPRTSGAAVATIPRAHSSRVKALAPFSGDALRDTPGPVASASSDGSVKLWDFRVVSSSGATKALAQIATGARLTCLTTFNPRSTSSARQAAREAAASKAKARENDTNPPPLEPQKPEQGKGSKTAALAGIAHDGIVEFPDEQETGKGKKRKKGGKGTKAVVGVGKVANVQNKGAKGGAAVEKKAKKGKRV